MRDKHDPHINTKAMEIIRGLKNYTWKGGKKLKNNNSWLAKNVPAILALVLLVLAFTLFFVVILAEVPQGTRDIVMVIIGLAGGNLGQVYSFYFGSSEGSRNKDRPPLEYTYKTDPEVISIPGGTGSKPE